MKIAEKKVIQEIGRRANGTAIVKIQLINPRKRNWLAIAQSYYTKDQKKAAKLNHKVYLRSLK